MKKRFAPWTSTESQIGGCSAGASRARSSEPATASEVATVERLIVSRVAPEGDDEAE
jgi:hypothetical protein